MQLDCHLPPLPQPLSHAGTESGEQSWLTQTLLGLCCPGRPICGACPACSPQGGQDKAFTGSHGLESPPASGCRPKGPCGVTWSGCSCPKELGRSMWSQQGFLVEAAAAEIARRPPLGSSAMRASGTTSDRVSEQHILNCVCRSDN